MQGIEIDRTDAEREELVKKWINDYWLTVVLIVVLAIAVLYGLKWFRQSRQNILHEAAAEVLVVEKSLAENQLQTAADKTAILQQKHQDSSFSALTTLALAQKYFQAENYSAAIEQYDWLIQNAGDVAMRDIARLRKSRAQADAGNIEPAVSTLSTLEDSGFVVEGNLLKGDILLADGQFEEAEKAYNSLQGETTLDPRTLQQRLDLVNIKQQSQ